MAEGYARRVLSTASDDSRYRDYRHSPAVAEFDQPLATGGWELESRARRASVAALDPRFRGADTHLANRTVGEFVIIDPAFPGWYRILRCNGSDYRIGYNMLSGIERGSHGRTRRVKRIGVR
jgi:hypothetical protein